MTKPTDIAEKLEELKPFLEAHHCRTDVINEAAQVIRELVERERWRPIEDAPEGVWLLVLGERGDDDGLRFYVTKKECWSFEGVDGVSFHGPYADGYNCDLRDIGVEPTHFRPLPSPPEEGEA